MVEYTEFLEGIVHEPTQATDRGFDLTVADVVAVTDGGRVDFGGGELEEPETAELDTHLRAADDEYEWWHLEAGQYLLSYNETIATSDLAFTLQPRDVLLARGVSHPRLRVTDLSPVPLTVGSGGIKLKENARVSTLISAEPG